MITDVEQILKNRKFFAGKIIVIIGNPATGKTWLANRMGEEFSMPVIHTDDYMKHGYKDALYRLLSDVVEMEGPFIVEGIQGYRLLRKGVELDCFYPDVVIEVVAPDEQTRRVYEMQRAEKDFSKIASFNKMHRTILANYREMENPHPPLWYTVENIFKT